MRSNWSDWSSIGVKLFKKRFTAKKFNSVFFSIRSNKLCVTSNKIFFMEFRTFQQLKKYRFVLGSTSPRRLEILGELGVTGIEVVPSNFEENVTKEGKSPEEYVLLTAQGKSDSVVEQVESKRAAPHLELQPTIILASDTVVVCNGQIFEKPDNPEQQFENLKYFRTHRDVNVKTAVIVTKIEGANKTTKQNVVNTKLEFDQELLDDFLKAYVASGEGLAVAGGFKVQGMGGLLWLDMMGEYHNGVGLPFKGTYALLDAVLNAR